MLIENPAGQKWMENNAWSIDEAVKLIKGLPGGQELVIVFSSDSVQTIDRSVDEKTLRNLLDPADGNEIKRLFETFDDFGPGGGVGPEPGGVGPDDSGATDFSDESFLPTADEEMKAEPTEPSPFDNQ